MEFSHTSLLPNLFEMYCGTDAEYLR